MHCQGPNRGSGVGWRFRTHYLFDLQPNQNKPDEMTPTTAKKTIGCHFPCRRLRAAKATTTTQPLANFLTSACNENRSNRPNVRPTAIDASPPTTAATYSHSVLSGIIEKTRPRAIAKGIH